MKSLTVFDPKKVFTEVTKVNHAVLQYSWHLQTHKDNGYAIGNGAKQTHKVFLHKDTLYTYLQKSRANGTRIEDISVDRFTGRVCEKKKKVSTY